MKLARAVGSTSEIWQIFVRDSSSTTGAGLTGLVFNTASLVAYYHRDTDVTATAISLVTMTRGTFASGGFVEIDATNMPGWYQFCPPNAALATGAKSCGIHLKGATNMAPLPIEVDLDAQVDVTKWLGTAVLATNAGVPNVNAAQWLGTAVTATNAGIPNVNNTQWLGTAVTATVAGVPNVNTAQWLGTAVTASTAGVPNVNVTRWVNGTVAATNSGIPNVNVTEVLGVAADSSTAPLTVDVVKWDGVDIGCTLPASGVLANTTNITAGTITTATNLTNLPSIPSNWITAAGIASGAMTAAVWDGTIAGHTTSGTFGGALNSASSAGDPWNTALPGAYSAGTAGNIVGNRLDAAVSTRMATYTQPTGFLAATFPGTVASPTNITAGTITTATNLTNLPTIPNNWLTAAGIASGALTAAVWDGSTTGHTTTGTFGGSLNSAGGSGDPWSTSLPGAYGSGTAGFILGTNLDATVSTRPTLAQFLAGGDVDGFTLEQTLKLCLSALAGKLSGAGTTTITIRSADDSVNRITATVTSEGNRTSVTLNPAG